MIHDFSNGPARGIYVSGTSTTASYQSIYISGNEVYNIDVQDANAVQVDGNVDTFQINNNKVHDVNGIGIDAANGPGSGRAPQTTHPINGSIFSNNVYNFYSVLAGIGVQGIYVDGGRNITVSRNWVHEGGTGGAGIAVNAELSGALADNVQVYDNLITNCTGGIKLGSTGPGSVTNSSFVNNTVVQAPGSTNAIVIVNSSTGGIITNNIFVSSEGEMIYSASGTTAVQFVMDYNQYFDTTYSSDQVDFSYNGTKYTGFANYVSVSGRDLNSSFSDPLFITGSDGSAYHLASNSPARGSGSNISGQYAIQDYHYVTRPTSSIDRGIYQDYFPNSNGDLIPTGIGISKKILNARVKNQGGQTLSGTLSVRFYINGTAFSTGSKSIALVPGQSITVNSATAYSGSLSGKSVTVVVDYTNTFTESNENNNTLTTRM